MRVERDSAEPPVEHRHLFAPFERGRLRLKNRVVHASMTTRYVVDGRVTDALVEYFANRARGGAALIISEPVNGLHFQALPELLGPSYFRVFRHGGWTYALAMPGIVFRSKVVSVATPREATRAPIPETDWSSPNSRSPLPSSSCTKPASSIT